MQKHKADYHAANWDTIAQECGYASRQAVQQAAAHAMRKIRKELEKRGFDANDLQTRETVWDRIQNG